MKEKEIRLQDYLDLIYRRKWTIIISFMIMFGASLYYNFTRAPVYESVSTFMIESRNVTFSEKQGMILTERARPVEFYKAVIKSRIFCDLVSQELIKNNNDKVYLTTNQALKLIKDNLSLAAAEYLDFIELKAEANDPHLAYLLAIIGTNNLKNRCQEIEREEAQNVVNFIENQKIVAKEKLETSEQELQEFKEKTNVAITAEDGGLLKKLVELENQLAAVETQKQLATTNLNAYHLRLKQREGQASPTLTSAESPQVIRLRNEISQLEDRKNDILQQFDENHPQVAAMDKKIEDKKQELVRAVIESAGDSRVGVTGDKSLWESLEERYITEELNVFILKNRERYYRRLISNFKRKHPNMLEHAIEMARLSRARTVSENLYNFLLEKGEEAKIKAATGTGGIRIIDPASEPSKPIAANTSRNLILGALLGLGLGLGLAFLKEYMDNTIRTTDDISRFLELPVMGVVPVIQRTNGLLRGGDKSSSKPSVLTQNSSGGGDENPQRLNLISRMKPKNPVVETYRSLRTNLQFASVDYPIRSMVITSPTSREGKTLTTANLGISYAGMGMRTLIVDTDLRKPMQHLLFKIKKSPGITDCLVQDVSLNEVTYDTEVPHLRIIPSGKTAPNPAEILTTRKMAALIETLQQQYDMLLFDSPPLIAVTDPVLLGSMLGGVLLVVKFGVTDRQVAANAVEMLKKARANIVGVVLNNTVFGRGYGYYRYYYHYYYYYSDSGERKRKKKR